MNDQRGQLSHGESGCITGCLGILSFVVLFLSIVGALTVASWVF